jgi:hypothetical protein
MLPRVFPDRGSMNPLHNPVWPPRRRRRYVASMRDVLLVVGNGLSIDLGQTFPTQMAGWDSSRPLSWDVPAISHPGEPLLKYPPHADAGIAAVRTLLGVTASDFEVFDQVLKTLRHDPDRRYTMVELRHLLVHSYVQYQLRANPVVTDPAWPWTGFFGSIIDRLQGAVSFNYDLNIETLLDHLGGGLGGSVRHLAAADGPKCLGLPLAKPHGSIDYEPALSALHAPATLPLSVYAEVTTSRSGGYLGSI